MAFISKAKFGGYLFHINLSAVYSFFNKFCAVVVDVIAVSDLEIPFKITAEITYGYVKMRRYMSGLVFLRIINIFVQVGNKRFLFGQASIYAVVKF